MRGKRSLTLYVFGGALGSVFSVAVRRALLPSVGNISAGAAFSVGTSVLGFAGLLFSIVLVAFALCSLSLLIGWSINAAAMVTDMNSDSVVLGTLLLLYGAAVGIWAFVDFIRILTGGLVPANGMGYKEDQPVMVQAVPAAPAQSAANDSLEALERLAKLNEQGILTDEEFQQKKKELLGKL